MDTLFAILVFLALILLIIGLIKPGKILLWSKKPTRLKVLGFWVTLTVILLFLIGIFSDAEMPADSETEISSTEELAFEEIDYENAAKQISIRYEEQDFKDKKMKVVVWVKNESEYILNGDLSVSIRNYDETKILGSDLISIENLNPTQETYAIIWVRQAVGTQMKYEWTSIKFSVDNTNAKNLKDIPYKFLKDKTESGNKIEFYLATDRDYQKMYEFIKKRKVNKGIFYHAVFVDDENYAQFSKYLISAMTFDEEQSKHIIATYGYNTLNDYKDFTYYEKNSWESVPNKIE